MQFKQMFVTAVCVLFLLILPTEVDLAGFHCWRRTAVKIVTIGNQAKFPPDDTVVLTLKLMIKRSCVLLN